jgi:hypothetical protein
MIFVISLVRKLRIVWKNTKRKDARIQILLVSRSNTCILSTYTIALSAIVNISVSVHLY